MGKAGPCGHCEIETTPLWRNGPPEKPVLCNACGSRWRTKGTLVNYMPMHAGGLGLKSTSTKKMKEHRSKKRKEPSTGGFWVSHISRKRSMPHNEDDCNTSSTGSGMSFTESCGPHIVTTGRASECWPPWVSPIPSKQRSAIHRHPPSANNVNVCSCPKPDPFLSKGSAEDDLLLECKLPSMTTEIGLGGVLMKPPSPKVTTPTSQASSLMWKTKDESDITREGEGALGVQLSERSSKYRRKEKTKPCARNARAASNGSLKGWTPNKALLENFPYNKRDVLQSCQSPLVFLELKDIINADAFMGLLSEQEQHQLMKLLSQADLRPDSLRCMFSSAQFESVLRGFQELLSAGMFDSQESGLSPRVLQHYQQLLTITDLTVSGWTERRSQFGKCKGSSDYAKILQEKEYLKAKLNSLNTSWDLLSSSVHVPSKCTPTPTPNLGSVVTEVGETPASSTVRIQSKTPTPILAGRFKKDKSCSRPRRGSFKPHGIEGEGSKRQPPSSCNLHSSHGGRKDPMHMPSAYGSMLEQEALLLDFPSTVSFQQAELLHQPLIIGRSTCPVRDAANQASEEGSKTGGAVTTQEDMWASEPNLDWCEFLRDSPSAGSVNDTF